MPPLKAAFLSVNVKDVVNFGNVCRKFSVFDMTVLDIECYIKSCFQNPVLPKIKFKEEN